MRLLPATLLLVLGLATTQAASPNRADERPNILWITSEDNAAHWLGCYGNKDARTPVLDGLAKEGVRFERAYATAPVCAVARAAILMGTPSVTLGTQHMRSRWPIPPEFQGHVAHLRKAGYYCANRSKTDYNFQGNDQGLWDDCSGKAHWRNRPDGRPFFAIINLEITHESNLFPGKLASNRKSGRIPSSPRLDVGGLDLPPHLPDLPAVRTDVASYHDLMTAMDAQVGEILADLEKDGLADNTIVFYYSDHGGATPRGKRYLEDTGTRVPMLLRVPEKWRDLSPFPSGQPSDELVDFTDLAPTVLSLAGLPKPPTMSGRAILGKHREEPKPNDVVLLSADRFDEKIPGMRRGITDGNWKYIRRFYSNLPDAPHSSYQMEQPAWRAWLAAKSSAKLSPYHRQLWDRDRPAESLFDLSKDPWEIHDLSGSPDHAAKLAEWRERLGTEMKAAQDTGVVPESFFPEMIAEHRTMHDAVRSPGFDHASLVDLAMLASAKDPGKLPALAEELHSQNPLRRYWGAIGCMLLGKQAAAHRADLQGLATGDPTPGVRVAAARALAALGFGPEAEKCLVPLLGTAQSAPVQFAAATALIDIDSAKAVPESWIRTHLKEKAGDQYLRKIAENLTKGRSPKDSPSAP